MATDPADRTVVRAACPHDCPDTCAMLVTTELRGGKRVAVEIAGDPTHPTTAGKLCTKVSRYLERTYHADRLLRPLKRVGPKGQGRFERVSWDEALAAIAGQTIAVSDSEVLFKTRLALAIDDRIEFVITLSTSNAEAPLLRCHGWVRFCVPTSDGQFQILSSLERYHFDRAR